MKQEWGQAKPVGSRREGHVKPESRAFPWNGGESSEGRSGEGGKAAPGAGVLAVPAARPVSPFPAARPFSPFPAARVWVLVGSFFFF